jgi:hypothetical protein
MTTIETKIEFGKKYRCKVTGLEGVCTGIVKHQYGCVRALIQPPAKKEDGTIPDGSWLDEEQLEGVEPIKRTTGGPMPAPKRAQLP